MTTTIDDITPRMASLENEVQEVRAQQRETNARLYAIEGHVTDLAARTVAIENRLGSLTERTATIEGRLTGIDGRLTTIEANTSDMRADIREIHARMERGFWAVIAACVSILAAGGGIIAAIMLQS